MTNPSTTFQLEPYPQELFDAVIAAVPAWIEGRVVAIATAELGTCPEELRGALANVSDTTVELVSHNLAALLSVDVDSQQSNPLHVLRSSTIAATRALQNASITPVRRDEFEIRAMPADVYAIGPLTWRDLGDEVHDAGITWGAWKAAVVLSRRRAEGKIS